MKFKLGECKLKGCKSGSRQVAMVRQQTAERVKVVHICIHCFSVFGEELPSDEVIAEKITELYTFRHKKSKNADEKLEGFRI